MRSQSRLFLGGKPELLVLKCPVVVVDSSQSGQTAGPVWTPIRAFGSKSSLNRLVQSKPAINSCEAKGCDAEFVECQGWRWAVQNLSIVQGCDGRSRSVARFLNSKNSHWTRLPKPGVQIPGCGNKSGLSGLVEQAQRNSFLSEIGPVWISGFGSPA